MTETKIVPLKDLETHNTPQLEEVTKPYQTNKKKPGPKEIVPQYKMVKCPCGSELKENNMYRHVKSVKHQQWEIDNQ